MKRKFKKASIAGNSRDTEVIKTKSQTTPDQAMSIRTILTKFANGTLNNVQQDEYYSEDTDDIRGIDPADMLGMAQNASLLIKEEEARKSKAKSKAEREKLKEDLRKEIENEPKPE